MFVTGLPQPVTRATYDPANRLIQRVANGVTVNPTWDANGNLTSDGVNGYIWDARNRLAQVSNDLPNTYDAFNRRIVGSLNGASTSYLYDGWNVVQEQGNGAVSANLLTGLGLDELISRGGATFLTDALGSGMALYAGGSSVQAAYGYDPYGVVSATGNEGGNSYKFTGREQSGITGLILLRNRHYNPGWGRFVSEDPIGLRGGINLYAYAGQDPVDVTDPDGLQSQLAVPLVQYGPPLIGAIWCAITNCTENIFETRRQSDPASARGLSPVDPGRDSASGGGATRVPQINVGLPRAMPTAPRPAPIITESSGTRTRRHVCAGQNGFPAQPLVV